jgi:hypothetical protein
MTAGIKPFNFEKSMTSHNKKAPRSTLRRGVSWLRDWKCDLGCVQRDRPAEAGVMMVPVMVLLAEHVR